MKNMEWENLNLMLCPTEKDMLRRLAKRRRVSMSWLVRELIRVTLDDAAIGGEI